MKWDDAYWGVDDKYTNGGKGDPYYPASKKSSKYSKSEKGSKGTKGGRGHYYGGQTSSTGGSSTSAYYGGDAGSSGNYYARSGSGATQRSGHGGGGGGDYYGHEGGGGGGGGDYYGHGGGGGGGGGGKDRPYPYADDNCKFSNLKYLGTDCWVNNMMIESNSVLVLLFGVLQTTMIISCGMILTSQMTLMLMTIVSSSFCVFCVNSHCVSFDVM